MADQCRNCGAELFYGQRFCRACGKTTDPIADENAPTQRMTPPPDTWGARQANTAPTPGQETSPVYAPPNYYQPPTTPVQPYTPARPRSTWPWIVAVIGTSMLVAMILGVIFISRSAHVGKDLVGSARRRPRDPSAVTPPMPPLPPGVPSPPIPPLPSGAESVLGVDNAQVNASDSETTLTKTFTLDKGALVTLTNINGSITVEASDGPEAELTVVKRGGSEQARESAQVKFFSDNGRLSLRTELTPNTRDLSVHYELKLPREIGRVEINLINGDIKISDIAAQITVATTNGDIELSDVIGVATAKTINGSIEAQLSGVPPGRPMDFNSVHGNIEISFGSNLNANLTASTTAGSIQLDDDFGIRVQKQIV
ncbi:MAG TPA: DUF4097 family beta strand repeat-containing protein, partial [Blastocatellia bacterium]